MVWPGKLGSVKPPAVGKAGPALIPLTVELPADESVDGDPLSVGMVLPEFPNGFGGPAVVVAPDGTVEIAG